MSELPVTFGLVEDERIEREAMARYIENTFQNACVLWQEEDGESGLSAVRREPPDVLIVDIEMPVMNGLELCEQLNHDHYGGVILISTAYDKFSYAKRAMSLRAFDYIVKPVGNDELFDALSRCMAESGRRSQERQQQHDMDEMMQDIGQYAVSLMAKSPQEDETDRFWEAIGWPAQGGFRAYVLHLRSKTPFSPDQMKDLKTLQDLFSALGIFLASDYVDDRHMLLILQPRKPLSPSRWYTLVWCYALLALQITKNAVAQISALCTDCTAVTNACRTPGPVTDTLPDALPGRISFPVRTWRLMRRREAEKYRSCFERYFRDGQFDRIRKTAAEIEQVYGGDSDLIWEIAQYMLDAAVCIWPDVDLKPVVSMLFDNKMIVQQWVGTWIGFCEGYWRPDGDDAIDDVIKLMETSFSQDITQAGAAAKLGLDPAYFSRLFKKRTGRNFSDMLIDIRMRHAETMLRENPHCSLEDLCRGCGLSSKTYLSEVFKKWKGMTITQFLKSQEQ